MNERQNRECGECGAASEFNRMYEQKCSYFHCRDPFLLSPYAPYLFLSPSPSTISVSHLQFLCVSFTSLQLTGKISISLSMRRDVRLHSNVPVNYVTWLAAGYVTCGGDGLCVYRTLLCLWTTKELLLPVVLLLC
jgi:hypothetical protein